MQGNTQAGQETTANLYVRARRSPTVMNALSTIALLIAGVLLVAPFFLSKSASTLDGTRAWSVIDTNDLKDHFRLMEAFDRSLRSGVVRPRWLADVNNGYGSATFEFQPGSFYYLTSITNLVVNNWIVTLFVVSALALAGSGLALYKLSRAFCGKTASAIACAVYMLFPIHLIDLYWRGAITQFAGYVFLPLDLYFAYKVGSEGRGRHYAGLGLMYGLHLLTDPAVGYMFTYTLAAYALLWSVKARDWRIGFRIVCGMAIGLLLSATYWLPAAVHTQDAVLPESNLVPHDYTYITHQPPRTPFETLIQGAFYLSIVVLVAATVILNRGVPQSVEETPATISKGGDAERIEVLQLHSQIWVILSAATIFLTTSYSYYISSLIPKIQLIVPPFRWLAISTLFITLLAGVCVDHLKKSADLQRRKAWAYGFVIFAALVINAWVSVSGVMIGAVSELPAYVPPPNIAAVVDDVFIPKGVTPAGRLRDTPSVTAQPEGAAIEVSRWDPEDRLILVNASVPTAIRLKTYNYPGWIVEIDGKSASLLSDGDGVQQVDVEPGIHSIRVAFGNSFARNAADTISIVALLLLLGLTSTSLLKKKSPMIAEADYRGDSAAIPAESKLRSLFPALQQKWLLALGIGAGAVTLVLVIYWLNSGTSSKPADDSRASTRVAGGAPQTDGSSGAEVRLYLAGRDSIPVAVDESAFDELVQALASSSRDISPLISSKRVFVVPNNTRVRILGASAAKTRIRIVEGDHKMAEGVVSERWMR